MNKKGLAIVHTGLLNDASVYSEFCDLNHGFNRAIHVL